jgi:PIN domain nuclease of toxin-antitoxin system
MLLLDTCCLLWLVGEQHRLSARARQLIAAHADSLFISAITGFEIALKQAKGRLGLPLPAEVWLERALVQHGLGEIPVTWRIAARSATLPPLHADPCDRIIVATAEIEALLILTPDTLIAGYPPAHVVW